MRNYSGVCKQTAALVTGIAFAGGLLQIASFAVADSAVTWGSNSFGQLGTGTSTQANQPIAPVGMSSGVNAVGAGGQYTIFVQNGAAKAAGYEFGGELGDGTSTQGSRQTPVAMVGLTSGVTVVTGGYGHGMAIQNGALKIWGSNYHGELGNGTSGSTSFNATPAGVSGLSSGVTAIAAGDHFSLAVQNGAVKAWGIDSDAQLGDGSASDSSTVPISVPGLSSGVTAVAAGAFHSLAIQNGALYSWGYGEYGQLGDGTAGYFAYETTPYAVPGLSSGVTSIATGAHHSLAIKNGNVYAWGYGGDGELGNGTTTSSRSPILALDTAANLISVAAGEGSSYALSSDGSVWVWGSNYYGQLGLGTTAFQINTPQHLLAPTGYAYTGIDADAEGYHVVATLATIASLGDTNGDNKINIADLGALATHYGQSGTNLPGDINNDGAVNIADLGILATHYGYGTSGSELPFADALKTFGLPAVPEPTSLALLTSCGAMLLRRSRAQRIALQPEV